MYSPVSKYSMDARKRMTYRSAKSKSCGYYMRIVFFFSSLIQSLIIVSLVLFLIYGQQQDSASVSRIQDLEMRFSQLTIETMSLRQQRRNLTHLLNITVQDKARSEWDLAHQRVVANGSLFHLKQMEHKLQTCYLEKMSNRVNCQPESRSTFNHFAVVGCNCGMEMETCIGKLELVKSNFTQTAMKMQMKMDQIYMERDLINLEAIQLRREKFVHDKALQLYQIKCKDEFINSLSGISNVSKAFLNKIDSLFRTDASFKLTCPKQEEYLREIRTNCTNLSEEVVQKFQRYLDNLGNKVSMSTGNISILTAENIRMTRDYNLCSQNRTSLIREHRQHVEMVQLRNDEEKEKLLKEKMKLNGDIEVLERSVNLKNTELDHLKQQLQYLNMSCMPRTGGGLFTRPANQPGSALGQNPGSFSNSGGLNQFNRNSYGSSPSSGSSNSHGSPYGSNGPTSGLGSTNTGYNKPSSTGQGSSSLGSNSGLGSAGLNKPGSSNQGSSSQFGSYGSSPSGTGINKQSSPGSLGSNQFFGLSSNPSSSNSNQNKFGSSGATGASSSSSNFGSSNSKFGSSSSNLGSSSSNLGSSSSNLGSSSSNLGSSSSNLGSSSSNLGSSSSNFGSSSSNFGSSSSKFGSSSSNLGSSSSNLGTSSSKFGSSSSTLGSSSSNLGSSSSKFGSSSSNLGSSSSNLGSSSSNNLGSSSSSLGSNFGSSSNSNPGSSSSSLSKTTSNSRGSSLFGSSSSSNSNLGSSSSSNLNKLSSASSKTSSSSSSGSSSTASKGFGWWGLGGGSSSSSSSNSNSNSDQRGSSSTGTGVGSLGSGRTNSYVYTGPMSYDEHIRELHRIINPQFPEDNRRFSR